MNQNIEHQLRYQETEFVISCEEFRRPEFTSVPLFKDERRMPAENTRVLAARYWKAMFIRTNMRLFPLDRYASFSQPWYDTPDKQSSVAYQGMALIISVPERFRRRIWSLLPPRWLAEEFTESLDL